MIVWRLSPFSCENDVFLRFWHWPWFLQHFSPKVQFLGTSLFFEYSCCTKLHQEKSHVFSVIMGGSIFYLKYWCKIMWDVKFDLKCNFFDSRLSIFSYIAFHFSFMLLWFILIYGLESFHWFCMAYMVNLDWSSFK